MYKYHPSIIDRFSRLPTSEQVIRVWVIASEEVMGRAVKSFAEARGSRTEGGIIHCSLRFARGITDNAPEQRARCWRAANLPLGDPLDRDTDDDGLTDLYLFNGIQIQGYLDTDGDGIINALEHDSDGDGLNDSIELGFTPKKLFSYIFII
jgi:hypothetical protein